jgi:lipoprotein signal peptidase
MRADLIGQRSPHPLVGPAVAGTVVTIDQLAKAAAPHLQSALVAPARNPEYAFGAAGGSALALIVGSVVVLVVFLAVIGRLASRVGVSPALPALIAGGMLGNTLDRIHYGAVRDFLVVPGGIINLADLAVAAGVIALTVTLASRASVRPRALALPPEGNRPVR